MTTPKWVTNKTHPIAIRDVLYYLKAAATLKEPVGRVFNIDSPEVLTCAEMILPGKAWLEFTVTTANGKTRIVQGATFNPRGLGGQLYWYATSLFHLFVFPTMLRNIIKKAASDA